MKKIFMVIFMGLLCMIGLAVCFSSCKNDSKKLQKETRNRVRNIEEMLSEKQNEEMTALKEEIEKLNLRICELDSENEKLENKLEDIPIDTKSYIEIKFRRTGSFYEVDDEDIDFYQDNYCSKKVKNFKILSPVVDEVELENQMTVYGVLSNKGIIWTTVYPNLYQIE